MSSSNQLYTSASIYFNDSLLSEAMDVTVKYTSNNQVQKTLAKGFAGVSPGSKMTEISISNAVPDAGFEVDVFSTITNTQEVKLTIFAASKTLTIKGFLMDCDFSKATDSESKLSFNFQGGEASWS